MVDSLLNKTSVIINREKDGKTVSKDVRPGIVGASACSAFLSSEFVNDGAGAACWEAVLSLSGTTCKPSEFASALCDGKDGLDNFGEFFVCRAECVGVK
jgi:hypothetical protein